MGHNSVYLVKAAGCNGDTRIGNQNKLDLVLFIKQSVLAFHHMDESSQSKRPLDWILRVDAILLHCKGDHSQCQILERHRIQLVKVYNIGFLQSIINFEPYLRCDHSENERPAIFRQLLEKDSKTKKDLTGKLCQELRHLLVDNEKYDFPNKFCALGSTSHCESNHARLTNRGYYQKGHYYYVSITSSLRHHYVIVII